jgi:hypothetical protein
MFSRIVPNDIAAAGTNSDSVGWRKDDLKVQGYRENLKTIIQILNMNRNMLNRKNVHPIAYRPGKRIGSGTAYLAINSAICPIFFKKKIPTRHLQFLL